jgi:hypothetical protein
VTTRYFMCQVKRDNTVLHVICLHASERHGLLRKGKVKKKSKAQIETISRVGRVIWDDSYIAIKISDSFGMFELEELLGYRGR